MSQAHPDPVPGTPPASPPWPSTLLEVAQRAGRALRWVVLVVVALLLMVPLSMVNSLVSERQARRESVVGEVTEHFGLAQRLVGPVLTIPYRVWSSEERERGGQREVVRTWSRGYAHVLPAEIHVTGHLTSAVRRRSIFEVPVYTADLRVEGRFAAPDLRALGLAEADLLVDQAWLSADLSDRRALLEPLSITVGDGASGRRDFEVGAPVGDPLTTSLQVPLPADAARAGTSFVLTLRMRGSQRLSVVPAGGLTTMRLASTWPHPSFDGGFLPASHQVSSRGFTADWSVLRFGRGFPQQWAGRPLDTSVLEASTLGVSLRNPTDHYALVARSARYASLFLVMTLLVLHLWELLRRQRIHPLQYLLVGCALCLFYVLELATAEHLAFATAYALAAAAVTALVGLYGRAVLASSRGAALLSALMAAMYGYLYVTLRAEDHALLLGAAGLFVMLAAVMAATRRMGRRGEAGS